MVQIPMQAALIGLVAIQTANTTFEAGKLYISAATPPPIEAVGTAPEMVVAGSDVLIEWVIQKRTECPGQNSRHWVGANGFFLAEPLGETTLPATLTPQTYMIQTHIPNLAPPGNLLLSINGWYQCPGNARQEFALGPVAMEVVE